MSKIAEAHRPSNILSNGPSASPADTQTIPRMDGAAAVLKSPPRADLID